MPIAGAHNCRRVATAQPLSRSARSVGIHALKGNNFIAAIA
jgi:hypothetical protein